ncbi:MAG: hypothetical protein V3U84_11530 [Thiotrichaceae bacterium]
MAIRIGGNTKTNTDAVLSSGIAINATTSTTILAAQAVGDLPHIKVIMTNDSNRDIWVKFQAASVDNDKKGFLIYGNSTVTLLEGSDIYTGEISAISDIASSTVYLTSY